MRSGRGAVETDSILLTDLTDSILGKLLSERSTHAGVTLALGENS
jgi:hypothetical protein